MGTGRPLVRPCGEGGGQGGGEGDPLCPSALTPTRCLGPRPRAVQCACFLPLPLRFRGDSAEPGPVSERGLRRNKALRLPWRYLEERRRRFAWAAGSWGGLTRKRRSPSLRRTVSPLREEAGFLGSLDCGCRNSAGCACVEGVTAVLQFNSTWSFPRLLITARTGQFLQLLRMWVFAWLTSVRRQICIVFGFGTGYLILTFSLYVLLPHV